MAGNQISPTNLQLGLVAVIFAAFWALLELVIIFIAPTQDETTLPVIFQAWGIFVWSSLATPTMLMLLRKRSKDNTTRQYFKFSAIGILTGAILCLWFLNAVFNNGFGG